MPVGLVGAKGRRQPIDGRARQRTTRECEVAAEVAVWGGRLEVEQLGHRRTPQV